MTRFQTASHLVSWAGLAPVARQSGPRNRNNNDKVRGSFEPSNARRCLGAKRGIRQPVMTRAKSKSRAGEDSTYCDESRKR